MDINQRKVLKEIGAAMAAIAVGKWDEAKCALWRAGDAAQRVTKSKVAA